MELELLTNATVVDDVIKLVRQQKPISSMDVDSNSSRENKEGRKDSTVPGYGEKEEGQLEENTKEKPKEESIRTVNKIF
jgi:hypothetical protein